jgi:PAS domain S-box-containing protein
LHFNEDGQPVFMLGTIQDITERKQAEKALRAAYEELEQRVKERTAKLATANDKLRQSHDELQTIYDGMFDGLLVADIETKRFVKANAAMARMLGYSETKLPSLSVKDIHPQEDLPFVIEQFQGLAEGTIQVSGDIPVLRKDGSVFYALVTSSKVTHDTRPCVAGFFRDITDRKQAEEALRQSEERYELAVRGAGVGIWDWDIRTGKLYYSPRWKKMFGFEENEIGDSLEDWARLLHPDERDWILKFQDDFLAGTSPTVTVEYRLRHKDGSYRWIVAHGLAVRDEQGRAYRLVGSHGDITDRKRVEEALRQSNDELRAICDGMVDGLLIADVETKRFLRANASVCRMLGYTEAELLSMSVMDIHPVDALPFVLEKFETQAEEQQDMNTDAPVVRKDGVVFSANVAANKLTYKGRPCLLGIFREIAERNR